MVIFVGSPNNNLVFSSTSILHFLVSFEKFFNRFRLFFFNRAVQFLLSCFLAVFVSSSTLAAHCASIYILRCRLNLC